MNQLKKTLAVDKRILLEVSPTTADGVEPMSGTNLNSPNQSSKGNVLRISSNPVDIFADDILGVALAETPRPVAASTRETAHEDHITEHVERLRQQAIGRWNEHHVSDDSAPVYDVIEPESIPSVPKSRPTIDLELPDRPSKPRYRNLFRDLRRNRGES